MTNNVKPIPEGTHTLTPYLIFSDAVKAIEFYKQAFDAEQLSLTHTPDGMVLHAEIKIGDSKVMMSEECAERGCVSPTTAGAVTSSLMLYSTNVDEAFAKAVEAGCLVRMPVMNMFWGDRWGQVADPFGHIWSLAQHIEDVNPADMPARAAEAMKQMSAAASK